MTIALATFAGILALIVGIYFLFVAAPEAKDTRDLQKRLKGQAALRPRKSAAGTLLKSEERLSEVEFLNDALLRFHRFSTPIKRKLVQADMSISVGTLLLGTGCLALLVGLAGAWLTHMPWFGVALGGLASFVPYGIVKQKAAKRILLFEEQFPEALDLVSRALRAGHAFTTGLAMVAEESPQPVAGEFRTLYEQQNFGMPVPDAMRAFAERIPLLDARFFVTAVLTQRDAGGNLAEILDNLASVIRERFKVKRQVRVMTAHARITGWVLACLPPALAVAFMVRSPEHIMLLVNDPLGVKMIVGAIALQVLGTLIIRRLVDIEF